MSSERDENRRRIVRGMAGLASQMPLDKLPVIDICTAAGVSRQTFYRCFEDKYAAVMWYFNSLNDQTVHRIGDDLSWEDGYGRLFAFLEHGRGFVKWVSESRDYNSLFAASIRESEAYLRATYLNHCSAEPSDLIAFQIHAWAHTATQTITDWVDGGCALPPDDFTRYFISLVPRELYRALSVPSTADDAFSPLFF